MLGHGDVPQLLNVHRLVANNVPELRALRGRPAGECRRVGGNWVSLDVAREAARDVENRQVVFRQPGLQLVIAPELSGDADLVLDRRQAKMLTEERVGSEAIIDLEVVCSGIRVLVPSERVLLSVQLVEWKDRVEDAFLHHARTKAAVVFRVVAE